VLAVRLGNFDSVEVAQIAAGGILHDIGKRHIPLTILNKTSKLTDAEWEVIQQHPVTGYRELAMRDDLTEGQLMMVYQHHERLDGSGYPAGITGDEIHPWAKICAVADVFDAMTCQRSYRRAIPIAEVFSYLRRMAGIKFDEDIVDCWLSQTAPSGTAAAAAQ
jgi:HD-GYP domain-containing protein (c-di-GMP phosphodiesterase class II)